LIIITAKRNYMVHLFNANAVYPTPQFNIVIIIPFIETILLKVVNIYRFCNSVFSTISLRNKQ
jgi:hypothetical protein